MIRNVQGLLVSGLGLRLSSVSEATGLMGHVCSRDLESHPAASRKGIFFINGKYIHISIYLSI